MEIESYAKNWVVSIYKSKVYVYDLCLNIRLENKVRIEARDVDSMLAKYSKHHRTPGSSREFCKG